MKAKARLHSGILLRSQRGSFAAITTVLACLVLLPVGLFTFEVGRINLAQKELKAATDAAALAGAIAVNKSANTDANALLEEARNAGLMYLKRNSVCGAILDDSTVSATVDQDSPSGRKGTFDLLYDSTNGMVVAKAAYGVPSAFGSFLGLGSHPVHGISKAVTGGSDGGKNELIVVFDNSNSMGNRINPASKLVKGFLQKLSGVRVGVVLLNGSNRPADTPIALDPTKSNMQEAIDYFDQLNRNKYGTHTSGALQTALDVARAGHSDGGQTKILFITDGIAGKPTGSHEVNTQMTEVVAHEAYNRGIPIYGIGFFHSGVSNVDGRPFMTRLIKAANGGQATGESKMMMTHDLAQLGEALNSIDMFGPGGGNAALVN